jgi:hypothetical protein
MATLNLDFLGKNVEFWKKLADGAVTDGAIFQNSVKISSHMKYILARYIFDQLENK